MNTKSDLCGSASCSPATAVEPTGPSRRNVVLGATALGAAVTIAAPAVLAQTGKSRRVTLSYYPWIKQQITQPDLKAALQHFVDLLQQAAGNSFQIDLLDTMEIPDQLEELKTKPTGNVVGKVGLLNPIGYALTHAEMPEVEGIAVIRRQIGEEEPRPYYKAQFYTHKDMLPKISRLSDARGFSVAFGSAQSTSNFLVPAAMLWEQGVHPLAGFKRAIFAGGHPEAAIAVYKREADIGAGHDGAIVGLASDKKRPEFSDAKDILRNIAWSDPIPSDPVAIHTADPEVRKQFTNALLQIAKPKETGSPGNQAIKAFWDTDQGFDPIAPNQQITAASYASLMRMMYPLGLRSKDMLRRS